MELDRSCRSCYRVGIVEQLDLAIRMHSSAQASVFNTVNYNVSLARAWTAIALQQRRFLREDLQEELKRMQSDVLAGVLNQIRDLVRKRKHALAVSSAH